MSTAGTQTSKRPSAPLPQGKAASAGLWTVQVILALLFVYAGVMKFMMPPEQMTKGSSLPLWFIYFIGVCEVLGAAGLILPALLRILPVLTPVAASGLAIIMTGATVISWPMGKAAAFPFVLCALCVFVAYGRFKLRPISPKS